MSLYFQFLLLMKAGSNWNKYFISRQDLLSKGLFGGLFVSLKYIQKKILNLYIELGTLI